MVKLFECESTKFKIEFFKEEIPNKFEFFSSPHPPKNAVTNIKEQKYIFFNMYFKIQISLEKVNNGRNVFCVRFSYK
ncbi:hypothetical protein LEP1GSC103_1703 [Leptospira borgpetersenii serovar Javanica str. UI 09931]|uniref:Uncharacterized protein n=4 Tax=Leptospira borgpetersenii TaxID=174 RepID=A0A0S2IQ39_LEPBO|nr:hypothetical protein LBBP_01481 [Leptospira borgpetersenii serovar Ballum]EKP11967.1 hypothetical protein LEP1GSC128_0167 [Leptospira borgpetersenii str. 200801926]EKQ90804.1 hypothetical protein LEP1GSC101_1288 [Leptospira borgpetersenii str. UI 09149]EKR00414.1 hypothetical protein LEP1GSC121_1283 [Leptospira borgpetersenii serovar Castellonis str. 200801910]EMN11728.1 hypothetical protein LEP1GSC055_1917 [Leptospira borgpetersenii str. Brem 307]EMN18888.1 hypothetical protein LEP1GSC056_